jgi:hypothetical protein
LVAQLTIPPARFILTCIALPHSLVAQLAGCGEADKRTCIAIPYSLHRASVFLGRATILARSTSCDVLHRASVFLGRATQPAAIAIRSKHLRNINHQYFIKREQIW